MWGFILFAAATALLFRMAPFFLKNSSLLNDKNGNFYRFLSYSAQAMIGLIIYNTAIKHASLASLVSAFTVLDAIKIALLLGCFVCVVYSKRMLPSLFLGLGIYWLALLYV